MKEEKRGANLEISSTDLFQAFPKESPTALYISLLVKKRFLNSPWIWLVLTLPFSLTKNGAPSFSEME